MMDILGLSGDRKHQRISLEEGGGGSEEESSVQGLMDSNCIQYRVTGGGGEGGGGSLSYRVVSQDGDQQSNGSAVNASSLGNAVLASPLNGQFYVIGNPSDVLGGMGQRTIAPRAGPFALEPSSVQNPKEDRHGTRRATHNEVERRRRDNINNWIMKLGKLIPDCNNSSDNSQGGKHAQSKGGILAKACEYLAETRNTNQRLVESHKQNEGVSAENERLSLQLEQLKQENSLLKQQLQNHGIVPQSQDIKFSM
eukprot:GFUD01011968.1.p1 GENE.GFUD01011968.1~~GFUD01011968.1.p1  ORF type:complete len:253 (-),score=63.54 GFUD01011968.1:407-1165(-)